MIFIMSLFPLYHSHATETSILKINIENIAPDQQYIIMYLCSEAQFLSAPCHFTLMKAANDTNKTFIWNDAPTGEWALVMFHDQDGNGKMKRGLIFPKEGYGFSMMRDKILSKPKFKKAKFTVHPNQVNDVSILVRY